MTLVKTVKPFHYNIPQISKRLSVTNPCAMCVNAGLKQGSIIMDRFNISFILLVLLLCSCGGPQSSQDHIMIILLLRFSFIGSVSECRTEQMTMHRR